MARMSCLLQAGMGATNRCQDGTRPGGTTRRYMTPASVPSPQPAACHIQPGAAGGLSPLCPRPLWRDLAFRCPCLPACVCARCCSRRKRVRARDGGKRARRRAAQRARSNARHTRRCCQRGRRRQTGAVRSLRWNGRHVTTRRTYTL